MSGFLSNIIDEFTHQGDPEQQQQQQQQQSSSSYSANNYQQQQPSYGSNTYQQQSNINRSQQGPPLPPPWRAIWEGDAWLFINEETGQRTFDHPAYSQSYTGRYNPSPSQKSYASSGPVQPQQPAQQKNHNVMYGVAGAAAGLAGGALLMHEGEEVKDKWEGDEYRAEERVDGWEGDARRDEYRAEDRIDQFGDDIRDAPEDAARWAGEKVQDVEDIPQDVEGGFDRMEDRVEDFPDRIADDVGQDVGRVEDFGDNVDDAYDDGRDEQRYDDDDRY